MEHTFVLNRPTKSNNQSKIGTLWLLCGSRSTKNLKQSETPKKRVLIGEVVHFLEERKIGDAAYFEQPAAYRKKKVWFPEPIRGFPSIPQGQDLAKLELSPLSLTNSTLVLSQTAKTNVCRIESRPTLPSQLYHESVTTSTG